MANLVILTKKWKTNKNYLINAWKTVLLKEKPDVLKQKKNLMQIQQKLMSSNRNWLNKSINSSKIEMILSIMGLEQKNSKKNSNKKKNKKLID
jgi:hypothetical protein